MGPVSNLIVTPRPLRRRWSLYAVFLGIPTCLLAILCLYLIWFGMFAAQQPTAKLPGESFKGPLPKLTAEELAISAALKKDLAKLAGEIGERSVRRPTAYAEATKYIEEQLQAAGYKVRRQIFQAKGRPSVNLIAEILGGEKAREVVVIGAHYDSVAGCPGANDNGTGTVSLLALARALKDLKPARTLRFVAFANEESPYFKTDAMGSLVYARECQARKENVVAMLSLETMGYYSDEPNSQKYPAQLSRYYPTTGNFIGFVSNVESRKLMETVGGAFRRHARFPSEGGALPAHIDGVGWSDHWSFWQCGYQAVMVTDTALFRYPHYHRPSDTPDKVDYARLARVVAGLQKVIAELASPPQ